MIFTTTIQDSFKAEFEGLLGRGKWICPMLVRLFKIS